MNPITLLRVALAERALGLSDLMLGDQVVLFGSRAVGCATDTSDWDVLIVDAYQVMPRVPEVDLISVGAASLESMELGAHVRAYGIWLKGAPARNWSIDYELLAARKLRVLNVRLASAREAWPNLSVSRRLREAILLRRDLQRLHLLRQKQPIPPKQLLDMDWPSRRVDVGDLCRDGVDLKSVAFFRWFDFS